MADPKEKQGNDETPLDTGIPDGSDEGEAKGTPNSDRERTEKAGLGNA